MSLLLEALKKAEYKKQHLKHKNTDEDESQAHTFVTEENANIQESHSNDIDTDNEIKEQLPSDWDIDNDDVEITSVSDELDLDIDPDFIDSGDDVFPVHNKTEETTVLISETDPVKSTEPNTDSIVSSFDSDNTAAKNTPENTIDSNHSDIKDSQKHIKKEANSDPDSANIENSSANIDRNKEVKISDNVSLEKKPKSPEALNQLIQQQNSRYGRNRLGSIILIILIAIAFVSTSGYYFYTELLNNQRFAQVDLLDLLPNDKVEENQFENPSQQNTSVAGTSVQESLSQASQNLSHTQEQPRPITEQKLKTSTSEQNKEITVDENRLEENIDEFLKLQIKQTIEEELNRRSKDSSEQLTADLIPSRDAKIAISSPDNLDDEVTLIDDSDQATWADVILPNEDQVQQVHTTINQNNERNTNIFKITRRNISNQVLQLTQKAYKKYLVGKYQESEKIYQQILLIKPNYIDALLGLAAIAMKNNNVAKAQKLYYQVLLVDPDNTTASIALNQLKKSIAPLKTEQKLKSELQNAPENTLLQAAMGNLYASQQRWKLAQSHYFKAYSLERNNIVYCYNLAISLDNLGKIPQAIHYYEKTLSLSKLASSKKDKLIIPFDSEVIINRLKQLQGLSK